MRDLSVGRILIYYFLESVKLLLYLQVRILKSNKLIKTTTNKIAGIK